MPSNVDHATCRSSRKCDGGLMHFRLRPNLLCFREHGRVVRSPLHCLSHFNPMLVPNRSTPCALPLARAALVAVVSVACAGSPPPPAVVPALSMDSGSVAIVPPRPAADWVDSVLASLSLREKAA